MFEAMSCCEDEDVDFLMTKLQHLQEARYDRMCSWYRSSVNERVKDQTKRPSSPNKRTDPTTSSVTSLLRKLQDELMALLAKDDDVFRQLLVLRRSITEFRLEQQQQQQQLSDSEDEEANEDMEVLGFCKDGGKHDCESDYDSFFSSGHCMSCKHDTNNSEDSAISLESSNLSSLPTSLAPSPTNVAPASLWTVKDYPNHHHHQPSQAFHRHNVTFPPTRYNRHSRFNMKNNKNENNLVKSRTCSLSIPNGVDGLGRSLSQEKASTPVTSSSNYKADASPLVQMLVRSRSITFLPRGALIRREESTDSGFHGLTSAGEIFV